MHQPAHREQELHWIGRRQLQWYKDRVVSRLSSMPVTGGEETPIQLSLEAQRSALEVGTLCGRRWPPVPARADMRGRRRRLRPSLWRRRSPW